MDNERIEDHPPELERDKIEEWLAGFLPKLKRTTTRTQKCRLISAIERMDFEDDENAFHWQYCGFVGDQGYILDLNQDEREKFDITTTQRNILESDPSLMDIYISRWDLKAEEGKWKLSDGFEIMSIGGEAIVIRENFENLKAAVRVQVFDPFLFTDAFDWDNVAYKIHISKDFLRAQTKEKSGNQNFIPIKEYVIRHYANIELFHRSDEQQEDCVGWITIMERAENDLRSLLKEEKLDIDERKQIGRGIFNGLNYLNNVGIHHFDFKLENILLLDGIPRIIDFGLVNEETAREGYRQMGYCRRGSKYRNNNSLSAGSPGFSYQNQLTSGRGYEMENFWYFLLCSWKTTWSLLYKTIDDEERCEIDQLIKSCDALSIHKLKYGKLQVFNGITKIIHLDDADLSFCLDDPNLTTSCQMSSLNQDITKCVNQDMKNLTKNIFDQKSSQLCVPISVTTLLRHAIKKDLDFVDEYETHSFEKILSTLTMIVYPRSMAGLNLNPNVEEQQSQINHIEILLKRLCQKTYLMESGWEIIRLLGHPEQSRPIESICKFEKVLLSERFQFTRPVTVTAAIIFPPDSKHPYERTFYHQMTMDRVENNEYVLQNNEFSADSPVIRVSKFNPYFTNENLANGLIQFDEWYLHPVAYTLTLIPKQFDAMSSLASDNGSKLDLEQEVYFV